MNCHSRNTVNAGARLASLLLGLLPFVASAAFAHDPGLSYAELRTSGGHLYVNLTFSRADVQLPPADAFEVYADGQRIAPTDVLVQTDASNAMHLHETLTVRNGAQLRVRSALIEKLARGHRQFLTLRNERGQLLAQRMLSANEDQVEVTLTATSTTTPSFADFLVLGVKHILTGYDHLVFLFGLLIVGGSFRSAVKIITSFTVAHSITLALATLNIVTLPSRIVEPLIAASIAYVGIENLFRRDLDKRWRLTFFFGLVHGLGFASALRELGIGEDGGSVIVPLLSFNLGVELGQISIAALALPLIWRISRSPRFATLYEPASSVVVSLAGGWWLLQRTLLN